LTQPPEGANGDLVAEFHRRQGAFYGGGPADQVAELLAEDVRWHVPGTSPIAGDHRGREAVLAYFERRRRIARGTMRMTVRGTLLDGDAVVQLVDGHASLHGGPVTWRTVGVYRIRDGRLAEAWLVPFELELFDRLWTPSVP
jgi:ketosteroid isomerase-like protein